VLCPRLADSAPAKQSRPVFLAENLLVPVLAVPVRHEHDPDAGLGHGPDGLAPSAPPATRVIKAANRQGAGAGQSLAGRQRSMNGDLPPGSRSLMPPARRTAPAAAAGLPVSSSIWCRLSPQPS
jgi:hypothetical protein